MELTEARFLPEEYNTDAQTIMCGDEVVFSLWDKEIWSVKVKNKQLAEAYKKYFFVLYEKAKEK